MAFQERGDMSQKGNNQEFNLRQLLQSPTYIRRQNPLLLYLRPLSIHQSSTIRTRIFFEILINLTILSYLNPEAQDSESPLSRHQPFPIPRAKSARITNPTAPSKPKMPPSLRAIYGKIVGGLTVPVALVFGLYVCIILMLIEPILSRDADSVQRNCNGKLVDTGPRLQYRKAVAQRRGGERMLIGEDRMMEHEIQGPRLWSRHEEALVMADGWDAVLRGGLL